MPEYLSPGVYIEEFEIGAKPIEGVSTSTAGFLGLTERGPVTPKLVTSWNQFAQTYGEFMDGSYLAYAVDGFFRNEGQRCYIGRIVGAGADSAELTVPPITFTTLGPGEWGNRVAIRIEGGSISGFKLTIAYWSRTLPSLAIPDPPPEDMNRAMRELLETASVVEVYDNLSLDEYSPDYIIQRVNGVSHLVTVTVTQPEPAIELPELTDADNFFDTLADGVDGAAPTRDEFRGDPAAAPGTRRGLTAFTEIDPISIVYVPDLHIVQGAGRDTLIDDILSHCESLKDRFAILEASNDGPNYRNVSNLTWSRPSKYGAFYYPWIKVYDPLTKRNKLVPPGGYIAGIYARSDQQRGVHKAPANELVRGATDLDFQITKGEQDVLNPKGVNCIRAFPGRGMLVWGARTTILDPLWKYINVRRLFIFLEESIEEGTQWVVFEPNDQKLWARVRATITGFLTTVWRAGALFGNTPEEAFFVKCDETTMTQDDIDNGRLICIIGVAPVKPAEFVIFRIAQWSGGSETSE